MKLGRLELAKLLVALTNEVNAESYEATIFGISDDGVDIGDWTVTVTQIRAPE